MASNAYSVHLHHLLKDAEELDDAHSQLKSGGPGRQYNLASLNRAAVVMSVSAWESYIEELMRESVLAMRPPIGTPPASWTSLQIRVTNLVDTFNNPSVPKVERLISNCIGLPNTSSRWAWQNTNAIQAAQRLTDAMVYRHQIAHGVNPRPVIHNQYSSRLPNFFRKLARCTDDAVRDHLVNVHGVTAPWPP